MSDNTSVIDAIKLIAKATKEDSDKMSDMAKGALHADQIDACSREPEKAPWYAGPLQLLPLLLRLLPLLLARPQRRAIPRSREGPGKEAPTRPPLSFRGAAEHLGEPLPSAIDYCADLETGRYGRQVGPALVGGRRLRIRRYSLRMQRLPLYVARREGAT